MVTDMHVYILKQDVGDLGDSKLSSCQFNINMSRSTNEVVSVIFLLLIQVQQPSEFLTAIRTSLVTEHYHHCHHVSE